MELFKVLRHSSFEVHSAVGAGRNSTGFLPADMELFKVLRHSSFEVHSAVGAGRNSTGHASFR